LTCFRALEVTSVSRNAAFRAAYGFTHNDRQEELSLDHSEELDLPDALEFRGKVNCSHEAGCKG
jgi:hypothetical protein